jgi:hypothetical protein
MIRLLKSHTQAWPKLFFTSVEAQTDMPWHFHKRNHHGPPPNTWNKRFFLCIGFVHVQISDIWSNLQGFEHMGSWGTKIRLYGEWFDCSKAIHKRDQSFFSTSVEVQTDMPWLNRADKPTRLTVKTTSNDHDPWCISIGDLDRSFCAFSCFCGLSFKLALLFFLSQHDWLLRQQKNILLHLKKLPILFKLPHLHQGQHKHQILF